MIDFILDNIPDNAPEMLTNFILEKEQELGGKLYVQLAYKTFLNPQKHKNVVVTIFCRQPDKTFPLPDYNNVSIKSILEKFKHNIPAMYKTFLAVFDVQKMLNKAFEALEKKHGNVKIVIYNKNLENGKIETFLKQIYPHKEEESTFRGFIDIILTNLDDAENLFSKMI